MYVLLHVGSDGASKGAECTGAKAVIPLVCVDSMYRLFYNVCIYTDVHIGNSPRRDASVFRPTPTDREEVE